MLRFVEWIPVIRNDNVADTDLAIANNFSKMASSKKMQIRNSKIKELLIFLLLAIFAVWVSGCEQEGAMEKSGKAVDKAVEDAGDALKDAKEKMEDAVEDEKKITIR